MQEPLYDVFISHASKDKQVAEAIVHHFESLGIRCFLAKNQILPGAKFPGQLTQAITSSRALVLIVSNDSNKSPHVLKEIGLAADVGLDIVQFKLADVKLNPDLRYHLTDMHWLDAIDPPLADRIRELGGKVCSLLSIVPTSPFNPASPKGPAETGARAARSLRGKIFLPWALAGFIAIAAALGFARYGAHRDLPGISIFDSNGAPLKDGSVFEGIVTEIPNEGMRIDGHFQMTNTGKPVMAPIETGWRLPKELQPAKTQNPVTLRPGDEFAYLNMYNYITGHENIETMPEGGKKELIFSCILEPGQTLPAEVPVEYIIRRAEDAEDLVHVRLRLHPVWAVDFQPEGSEKGLTLAKRALNVIEPTGNWDIDLTHGYRLVNRSAAPLDNIKLFSYVKARKPFDKPSPELPMVGTAPNIWPSMWPEANPPSGFTAVQIGEMSNQVLKPGEATVDWAQRFFLGRGGYVPPGKHEIAIDIRSAKTVVYRGSYTIDVPESAPFPRIELLGEDDKPLLPGSRLQAVIDQRWKDKPDSMKPDYLPALALKIRVIGSAIQKQDIMDGAINDVTWLLLTGEDLHSTPEYSFDASSFKEDGIRYHVGNIKGSLLQLSDEKPHPLELVFPMDSALAHPSPGKPGLWMDTSVRRIRLIAVPSKREAEVNDPTKKPPRDVILFERDFELEITQPAPIELGAHQ